MAEVNGVILPFVPIGGVDGLSRKPTSISPVPKSSFEEILANEISNIKFSGHAQSRLVSRDIDVSASDLIRLEDAVEKAASKGANDSLIMLDDKAFIVSIKNRTVVTLLERNQMEGNIITKIDSAVFA
jgi:flagellar operon protein